MGKKSAPKAPNYTKLAEQQTANQNDQLLQQTWANRVNQSNPYGSSSWNATKAIDPVTGKPVTQWSQETTLNPQMQAALDAQMGMQAGRSQTAQNLWNQYSQQLGSPLDFSGAQSWGGVPQAGNLQAYTGASGGGLSPQNINTGLQQAPQLNTNLGGNPLDSSSLQGVDNAAATRQRAEDALYKGATSRLDPQWQQRQSDLETQLANRGITSNSAAYQSAMDDFNRQRTDAYSQAQNQAVTGAGTEAQRDYGMNLGLRQQQVGEQGQSWNQGLQGGQANNAAMQSQFGMGQSALQQQLAAQNALFGQQQQAGQYGLNQQQQAFNQQQAAGNQNFSQGMAQSQYQNQLRQQQLAEMMQQRGYGLQEINSLLGGQGVQNPQFAGYSGAGMGQSADLLGAAGQQYNAAIESKNAKNAKKSQGLGGLANTAASFFL